MSVNHPLKCQSNKSLTTRTDTHTTPSQITITLTHHHHHHAQTPKYLQPSSDSPNTQPDEPERTSNELRRSLSLLFLKSHSTQKPSHPPHTLTHSHTHTHTTSQTPSPIRINHRQPALSELSLGTSNELRRPLSSLLSPNYSSSALITDDSYPFFPSSPLTSFYGSSLRSFHLLPCSVFLFPLLATSPPSCLPTLVQQLVVNHHYALVVLAPGTR